MSTIFNADYFQLNIVLQSLVNGLSNGVLYAFLALALVFIFKTSNQLNFAQGEMSMVGAFVVFTVSNLLGVNVWIAMLLAMLVMFVIGALSWRFLLKPVPQSSSYAPLIVLLGLFLLFNAGAAAIWGTGTRPGLSPLPSGLGDQVELLTGVPVVHITYFTLGGIVLLLAVFIVIELWLRKTRMGLAYRAVTSNPESATYLGVSRTQLLTIGWGLAAAVGVFVGVLFSQQAGILHNNLLINGLLFGFAAAALGGFDSLPGALIGGLVVGLLEATVPSAISFLGPELNVAVALAVIFLVLVLKPSGLLGSSKVVRP